MRAAHDLGRRRIRGHHQANEDADRDRQSGAAQRGAGSLPEQPDVALDDAHADAKDRRHEGGNDHRANDHRRAVDEQAEAGDGCGKADHHKKVQARARAAPDLAVGLHPLCGRHIVFDPREHALCLAQERLEGTGAAADDERGNGRTLGHGLGHVAKQLAVDVALVAGADQEDVVSQVGLAQDAVDHAG